MANPFLLFYSRRDVQEEICLNAADREAIPKFSDIFGKRPDVIKYPNDVLELAKNGATSFHASGELWKNPLDLSTELRKFELDNLRIGWDLLIDIDCPYWDYSKTIAHHVVVSLKKHKISSISCKFSGNRGFHIAVPFEAFPKTSQKKETRLLFPDAAKIIMSYIIYDIDKDNSLTNAVLSKGIESVIKKTGLNYEELVVRVCSSCSAEIKMKDRKFEYICPFCSSREASDKGEIFKKCPKCNRQMEKKELSGEEKCLKCNSKEYYYKLNTKLILNIDAIMLSSRHLYRMPYSLHEKSGLVSLPISQDKILEFDKKDANPLNLKISKYGFLEKKNAVENEASLLFENALSFRLESERKYQLRESLKERIFEKAADVKFEAVQEAVPEELFPPCIKLILNGLEDGKKRALFVLINFLGSNGWAYDKIKSRLLEWNGKNSPPLRQNYLLGQLRYHKHSKRVLPPNCDNEMYMLGIGVCRPDNFCSRIKNPANYSIKKAKGIRKNNSKK